MSCGRAFEIDLADFLERPAAPEFDHFRGHYPRCVDCAPEVRAWTELHLLLQDGGPAHPAVDVLLRFEEQREALPVVERAAVERHLERCPSCRDELRALRDFDFGAVGEAIAPQRRWRLPAFALPRFRRLALHPAFAYALVLILLYPTLASRLGREVVEDGPAAPAPEDTRAAASPVRREAPSPEPQEAAPLFAERARYWGAEGRARAPAAGIEGEAPPVASAGPSGAALEADAPAAAEPGFAKHPALPGWQELTLEPGRMVEIATADVERGVVLNLPVPVALRAASALEIRVLDDSGRRELRERVAAPAADRVAVRVPGEWLAAGAYRAELSTPHAPRAPEIFPFRVRR